MQACVGYPGAALTWIRKFRTVRMARDDDELHFCWDEAKAESNLDKHGVSFEAASFVFDDPRRLEWEDMFARGEYRNIVVGQVMAWC